MSALLKQSGLLLIAPSDLLIIDIYYRETETRPRYPVDSFRSQYSYYDPNKYNPDYLYPVNKEVLGSWRHYNRSSQTLNERNQRANSPLVTRELTRSSSYTVRLD